MIKSKKILSALLIVAMVITMFSSFLTVTTVAIEDNDDKFCFRPFIVPDKAPRFSTTIKSGIKFVCNAPAWKEAKDGEVVYVNYGVQPGSEDDEFYKLVKGVNAFSAIIDAYDKASPNETIKIGPGEYLESPTINKAGLKFYGNYGGICPNGAFNPTTFERPLNPARGDSSIETVIKAKWNWTIQGNFTTLDGMTLSEKGQFNCSVSGKKVTNIYVTNNIFTGLTSAGVDCNKGYNDVTVIRNNRIVDSTYSYVFIGGGSMNGVYLEDNYFQNISGKYLWLTSTGNNGNIESLVSIQNNVFNNCAHSLEFTYQNGSYGANLDYKRIQNNIFYKCGSSATCIMNLYFLPEMDSGAAHTDTGCKTHISNNLFYDIPAGVTPIKIAGKDSTQGKTINYKVSVVENKFLFANAAGGKVIDSTLVGTLDASRNFYGESSKGVGKETPLAYTDSLFNISETIIEFVSMPYYLDYDKTVMSAVVNLEPGLEADVVAGGFEKNGVVINNTESEITAIVEKGVEQVDISKIVKGANISYKVYKDFLLEREVKDGKLFVLDDITRAYIVATNNETKASTKYSVAIIAKPDKTLAELKEVVYKDDDVVYSNVVKNDLDITVNLDSQYVYFPADFVISPSANYKVYTDAECKNEYTGNWYMQPGDTVLYVKVTSGDTKTVKTYKLTFKRTGDVEYDARIFSAESPKENILIFNNDRKRVTYRPFILTSEVEFKFNVTDNATYTIYEKYENGVLSNPISTSAEPKVVKIADALSHYYIEVVSKFGFKQIYTLAMYNDVKSTDNLVYAVSGIDGATIENNVITIPASSTLSVVNALFDTDPFADVTLYADENKSYKVPPSSTYKIVNKREVEVRTFQLGNSARTSYFYMVVTSEAGVPNEYLVILKKQVEPAPLDFADVKADHWAKSFIDKASSVGLMSGQQDINNGKNYFMPYNNITRQEVAAVLCTSLGIEPYSFRGVVLSEAFKDSNDIPEWSYNYIKAVYQLGAMVGSDGKFNFEAKITRQEFFSAIANMFKLDIEGAKDYDLSKFSDSNKVASWALDATKAVVKAGIVEGSNGKLNPSAYITRAEVATIIAQCHKINK